jgi:ligand-binding sensor domain-containing protein
MKRTISPSLTFLLSMLIFASGCKNDLPGAAPRGPKWVVYQAGRVGISNGYANCVFADAEGDVWFGTNHGASYFNKNVWTNLYDSLTYSEFNNVNDSVYTGSVVTSITGGKDGSLWFGLAGGGVERYDKFSSAQTWIRYGVPDLPTNTVFSLAAELQELGEVWVGTNYGIGRFVPSDNPTFPLQGDWTTITQETDGAHILDPNIGAMAHNPIDNSIWFSVGGLAVEYYDIDNNQWGEMYGLPTNAQYEITSIAIDNTDHAWVGTYGGIDVLNINSGGWEHYYTYKDSATHGNLPNSPVNCVTTDYVSNRWFGTDQGLVDLNDTTWSLYTHENSSLPNDTVHGVGYDRNGNLWIATSNGVAAYNPLGTSF